MHNLCIVNYEGIEDKCIVKEENKLVSKVSKGVIREGNNLRGERVGLVAPIANEVNYVEAYLFPLEKTRRQVTFSVNTQ